MENKYIILMIPMDGAFEIERIFQNIGGIYHEYIIDSKEDLKSTLDSFGNDGEKIYNFLTNMKAVRGMKLVVDKVGDFIIPEGIYAEFINEDKLHREWTRERGNTVIYPAYSESV